MPLLDSETHAALDIEDYATVMTFTYVGSAPKYVVSRVYFGSDAKPIVGGGNYELIVTVNGSRLAPDSVVGVPAGVTKSFVQSRDVLLDTNDEIIVQLKGVSGDDDVYAKADLVDMSPLTEEEIFGEGSTPVDHNYGGTDALRVTDPDGNGIQDVVVTAYLTSDYSAGNRTSVYVRGRTSTNVHGRWREPLALDPADYTIVYSKPQAFTTRAVALTVT